MIDSKSASVTGYHIFLEPTGELNSALATVIQTMGASYEGPSFVAHVTLLAHIRDDEATVLHKAEEIARSAAPFTLTLGDIGHEQVFFRALYIRMEETEQADALHQEARKVFAMPSTDVYMPHLSLLYSNMSEEQKIPIIETLQYPKGESFLVDRVCVYETNGGAESWKKIKEIPFGS